jgi:TRAP-type C4-dicarboxylate transport system permease small subunit
MKWFAKQTEGLCLFLNIIAGCTLTGMMLLTTTDVVLRFFKMPLVGAYELVAFGGGIVVGFSIPQCSIKKGHILVDSFIADLSSRMRKIINLITRFMGLILFIILAWNMYRMGMDMIRSGEVSLTLELPFYPVLFGIAFASVVQCLVSIVQMAQVIGGTYE